jgi:3-methyladenine DNA glycosylase AlkD
LESMGTAQNRKIYARHGASENMFGVSFANLKTLKKKIKQDHSLAVQLWQSANVDAMSLATMIADPQAMDETRAEAWLKGLDYYLLVDLLVGSIVSKTSFAKKKMEEWTHSEDEWISQGGWHLLSHMAMNDDTLTDDYLSSYIHQIEEQIHSAKNRTRHSMNGALISIGIRSEELEKKAIAAAKRIGKVVVDHGETSCKTPDAIAYIKKTKAHRKKKAAGHAHTV